MQSSKDRPKLIMYDYKAVFLQKSIKRHAKKDELETGG